MAEVLKTKPVPPLRKPKRNSLFSGRIYFAQITFQTSSGNFAISTADMKTIVQYAKHAIVPICEYCAQYGPNKVTISSKLLTKTVHIPTGKFTDPDLQGWVNAIASDNSLPANSCIFVVTPKGITAPNVDGNAGYHSIANIPYIVAGVWAAGLTLADEPDVYAMVVSHEIAEMIVDPNAGGGDPEVCDPCDLNCGKLNRCYFNASNKFLGSDRLTPPGGFNFSYYLCAVVKPNGSSACPAPSTDCAYAPPPKKKRGQI